MTASCEVMRPVVTSLILCFILPVCVSVQAKKAKEEEPAAMEVDDGVKTEKEAKKASKKRKAEEAPEEAEEPPGKKEKKSKKAKKEKE